jgi:hypothetical protein
MADETKDSPSGDQTANVNQPASGAPSAAKRPYATLDLKATEIKITPVPDSSQSYASAAARGYAVPKTEKTMSASAAPSATPGPLPASTYANTTAQSSIDDRLITAATEAPAAKPKSAAYNAAPSSSQSQKQSQGSAKTEPVIVQKRGGFFSHMAAGIIGGVLALAGSEWALPQLGIGGTTSRLADDTAAFGQRLQTLEKHPAAANDTSKTVAALESRLNELEKSAQKIPALAESQSRLVAETKAALASSAGDSGMPEQLARISSVEDKLKALTEAGANNPNAGRLEQLAALTGKVSDLETSLATQLTALRKGVTEDVDARMASVSTSAEAAKSGAQRIDRDLATAKSDAVLLSEQLKDVKTNNDRLSATLKMAQDETTALKSQVEALSVTSAKPTDVAAAVKPVGEKLSTLEQSVQGLVKAEDERRANSERVLLSLELQNLKRAVDRGQKYGAELAAVQKASGGKIDLAALDKFKDAGVPGAADLTRDFRATANAAIDAETEPAEGGVVDRLLAGAKSIVRVRKTGQTPDDKGAEAVSGRMEIALKENRLADVLGEAKQLSPKALTAAQPFLDRVAARVSVETAVGTIETQLKSSLGSVPVPAPKAAP